jgi:hypothetical protein
MDFTNPGDVPLPLRASGMSISDAEERIQRIALMLDGRPEVRIGISFMDTKPHPFKDRLRKVDWETVELKENSEWALPRPNIATLDLPEEELSAWPIPKVERRGLSPAQLQSRRRAKATQAEQFRGVSRGHARYVVARALAPGMHPIFEESPMQHVDGKSRAHLRVTGETLCAFRDTFVDQFRHWFVRRLARVEVIVSTLAEPVSGLVTLSSLGEDVGTASVTPGLDGMRLFWEGQVPDGAEALVVRPVMDPGSGVAFDPGGIAGLCWRALPLRGHNGRVTVQGSFSQNYAKLTISSGAASSELRWSPMRDHPDTPFDPPITAQRKDGGPSNLVEEPWPDMRWPARISRVLDAALDRGMLGAWQGQRKRRSPRWVRYDLHHQNGDKARVFIIPPGELNCAWRGRNMRLVLQGDLPPSLMTQLVLLLTALDRRG